MAKRFSWIGLLVAVLLLGLAVHSAIASDSTDSLISINMTGLNASLLTIGTQNVTNSRLTIASEPVVIELTGVRVYPITCSFGLLRPGDIRSTGIAFTILNATNTTYNVTIGVSGDWAGTHNWTHSDDCIPGVDIVGLVAIVEDGSGHTAVIVRKTERYNYLVADVAPGEHYNFGLVIYAPTAFTEYSRKTNTIFISTEGIE